MIEPEEGEGRAEHHEPGKGFGEVVGWTIEAVEAGDGFGDVEVQPVDGGGGPGVVVPAVEELGGAQGGGPGEY